MKRVLQPPKGAAPGTVWDPNVRAWRTPAGAYIDLNGKVLYPTREALETHRWFRLTSGVMGTVGAALGAAVAGPLGAAGGAAIGVWLGNRTPPA